MLTSVCTFSILFTIHFLKCWQGEFIYGHLSAYIIGSKMLTVFQEWSLRKTVSFKRQIMSKDELFIHAFGQNRGFCVYYPSTSLQHMWKNLCEQLTVCSVGCFLWRVLWYDSMNKNRFPFFCDNHKTLSNLELNWKGRLIIVIMRFKNWGILLGWYSCISHIFSWGVFGHVLCLNWLHRSKNIWWIIMAINAKQFWISAYSFMDS